MHHRSEEAAVATEYALMVTLIAGVIAAAVFSFGLANRASWQDTCTEMASAMSGSTCP